MNCSIFYVVEKERANKIIEFLKKEWPSAEFEYNGWLGSIYCLSEISQQTDWDMTTFCRGVYTALYMK